MSNCDLGAIVFVFKLRQINHGISLIDHSSVANAGFVKDHKLVDTKLC